MIWFSIHNGFRERKKLPKCIRYLVKHLVCFIMRIDLKKNVIAKNAAAAAAAAASDQELEICDKNCKKSTMKRSETVDSDWISLNNRVLLNPIGDSSTVVKLNKNKVETKIINLNTYSNNNNYNSIINNNNNNKNNNNKKKKKIDTVLEFELIAILNKFIFYLFLAFIITLNVLLLYLFPYYLKSQLHFQD
jgi:hypothetical protein